MSFGADRSSAHQKGGREGHLSMAAHKLAILGDSNVALNDAGTHPHVGDVRLLGVLGKLQARAPVPDGEVMRLIQDRRISQACVQCFFQRRIDVNEVDALILDGVEADLEG